MKYMKELYETLNISLSDSHTYLGLAENLKKRGHLTMKDIRFLRIRAEASPTKALIESINAKRADLTVAQFAKVATKLKRIDVVKLLDKCPADQSLHELQLEVVNELATKLDSSTPTVNNWKDFAAEFNFNYHEVKQIQYSTSQKCNPTEKLLEFLYAQSEDFPLSELTKSAKAIGRNDVANIIDKMKFDEVDGNEEICLNAVQNEEDDHQQHIYALVNQQQQLQNHVVQNNDDYDELNYCTLL